MAEEFTSRQRSVLIRLFQSAKLKISATTLFSELDKQKEKFPTKTLKGILREVSKTDKLAEQVYKEQLSSFELETATKCLQKFLETYISVKYNNLRNSAAHVTIETIREDEESSLRTSLSSGSSNESIGARSNGPTPLTRSTASTGKISNGATNKFTAPKITVIASTPSNGTKAAESNGSNQPKALQSKVATSNGSTSNGTKSNGPNLGSTATASALPKPTLPMETPSNGSSAITPNTIKDIMQKVAKSAADGLSKSASQSLCETTQNNNNPQMVDDLRTHSKLYFDKKIMESLPPQPLPSSCKARAIAEQEQELIDDILYVFLGLPGDFITPRITEETEAFAKISFDISEQLDVSLRSIVQELLPMAAYYSAVQKFAQWSSNIKNQVLQALSEVIQTILNDYRLSITQLEKEKENNNLTLHKMHYLIHPNEQKLSILCELVGKISKCDLKSGTILSLLYDEIVLQTGDSTSQMMLVQLTEHAAVPYIQMLQTWILKGVIVDPYKQFFVVDHESEMTKANAMTDTAYYWENRYSSQLDRIPCFLENDADIILRTGKYLNVIRQCGKQISPSAETGTLHFNATGYHHTTFIRLAYHNASKTLLELLLNEYNLMGQITSVKRYFLLQQGDIITQLLDASEEELNKNVDKVTPVRLDNLLQLIVRMSSAKNDPCLEHLHCDLFTMGLADQMSKINDVGHHDGFDDTNSINNLDLTGLECFTFNYSAQWPVSIVLNRWVVSQYQMLFRLLFYCKHVDRQLCNVWVKNKQIGKNRSTAEKDQWRTAFALRQRMLNAIQHLEYYMMIEIIEPNWHVFTEKMKNIHNIDDVITIHQDFLHVCLQNCMLHYPDLLQSLLNICSICLNFCKKMDGDIKEIDSIGKEFDDQLVVFMQSLGDQSADTKFVNLVCRLNYNSYYTN